MIIFVAGRPLSLPGTYKVCRCTTVTLECLPVGTVVLLLQVHEGLPGGSRYICTNQAA